MSDELVEPGALRLPRLLISNYIDACAIVRRSAWADLGGYDAHMPIMGFEDWDFWLRMVNGGWKLHYLPELSFHYRVREGSMISDTNTHWETLKDYIFSKPELADYSLLRVGIFAERELKRLHGHWFLKLNRALKKRVRAKR